MMTRGDENGLLLLVLSLAGLLYGLYLFFRRWRQQRLLQDMPQARIRSAPEGYVKLWGRARASGSPLRAPLTHRACVWWSFSVESRSGVARWRVSDAGTSDDPFFLFDDVDHCLLEPRGAEVEPSDRRVWSGDAPDDLPLALLGKSAVTIAASHRYTETVILEDAALSVLGEYRARSEEIVQSIDEQAHAKLTQWKRDQSALLARFDADHDGKISPAEWDQAREAAVAAVRDEHLRSSPLERLGVIARPADGRPFLVGAATSHRLADIEAHRAMWGLALAVASLVAACWVLVRVGV
jgi:hypothetical protein